jgi:hypothetical protein
MINLNSIIQEFITQEIEPDYERERIELEHTRVREILLRLLGDDISNHFLMGSYIRHILIKRLRDGDKYDVDIMIVFNKTKYGTKNLEELQYLTLNACLKVKDEINGIEETEFIIEVRPQKASIGFIYADNFRIDIVPAIEIENGESYKIYDTRSGSPQVTNPEKHNRSLTDANKESQKLVPLIKLIKRWKDEKCGSVFKSFHLAMIAVELFEDQQLNTYLEGLRNFFKYAYDKTLESESVTDPANAENDISSYLDEEDIRTQAAALLNQAYLNCQLAIDKLPDSPEESINHLGKVFDYFTDYNSSEKSLFVLGDTSHQQVPRMEMNLIHNNRLKITAEQFVGTQPNKAYWLSQGTLISNKGVITSQNHYIKYKAHVNLEPPYQLYWQIVNTGEQATAENGLRGVEIETSNSSGEANTRWEPAKYTGKHFIECFVIKNGVCVARKKFFINILNNTFKQNNLFRRFLRRR